MHINLTPEHISPSAPAREQLVEMMNASEAGISAFRKADADNSPNVEKLEAAAAGASYLDPSVPEVLIGDNDLPRRCALSGVPLLSTDELLTGLDGEAVLRSLVLGLRRVAETA